MRKQVVVRFFNETKGAFGTEKSTAPAITFMETGTEPSSVISTFAKRRCQITIPSLFDGRRRAYFLPPLWASEFAGRVLWRAVFPRFHVIVRRLLQHQDIVSRRAALGGLVSLGSMLALGGCTGLGATGARYDASALSIDPTLLVTTTRKPVNGGRAKPWFGPERASTMTVARAKLVPPDDGRFSLAAVGFADWRIDRVEPVSGEVSDLLAQAGGGSDLLIYVHGFNQTFETAALDAAKLSDGIRFRGRTMVFSWPSKAEFFDYVYDRDSAMWSRDAFERVLSSIVSAPGASRVHIVAHSMGTMLALESLRQLYAHYGDTVTGRIGAVVFAAPDIDVDVFSSTISRIGPLAGKITVITATNDRALALSGEIAGGMTRVGAAEKATIEQLGVRVVDASEAGWGIINHDLFLSNAEVRRVIRRSIDTAAA
jgi:esterase/lipase superfamily enzyme